MVIIAEEWFIAVEVIEMSRILRNGRGVGYKSPRFKDAVRTLESSGFARRKIYSAIMGQINDGAKTIDSTALKKSLT